jgi:5-methylcytosine-specific restriction enzyme A
VAHAQADVATRGGASARGYDRQWRVLRDSYLGVHPFCEAPGCFSAATEVDHIVPIRSDPARRLDPTNLQALCHSCHVAKTHADHRAATR